MKRVGCVASIAVLLVAAGHTAAWAAECKVEMVDGPPSGVVAGVVQQLQPRHVKLCLDDDQPLCEIWLTKQWTTNDNGDQAAEFAPIDYALTPGSLVGVLRVARPCLDFRDQELPEGVYTLRYALQPDLDVHYESHDSRDFLLLVPAGEDKSPDPIEDEKKLVELSAVVTATTHPSIVPLVKPMATQRKEPLRRDEKDPNGWILLLRGSDEAGKTIPLELIVFRPDENAAP